MNIFAILAALDFSPFFPPPGPFFLASGSAAKRISHHEPRE
jgi:hypothetical protein